MKRFSGSAAADNSSPLMLIAVFVLCCLSPVSAWSETRAAPGATPDTPEATSPVNPPQQTPVADIGTPLWVWPTVVIAMLMVGLGVWSLMLIRQRSTLQGSIQEHTAELEKTRRQLQSTLDMLQRVATNVPGVVFSFTLAPEEKTRYRFPFISNRVQTLFGVDPDRLQVDGMALIDRVHPDDREIFLESIVYATEHKKDWFHQARLMTANGEYRWFEAQSHPQRQNDGHTTWYGYLSDIHPHKEMEVALRASEKKFRALVENANDVIYTLDPQARFTYVSPNFKTLLGYNAKEAIGESIAEFLHPEDLAPCQAFVEKVYATGEPQSGVEYRVRHHNGDWIWHTSNGALAYDETTGHSQYLGISRDISQQRRDQEELLFQSRFQKLVAQLSSQLSLQGAEDINPMIDSGLARIGAFFEVDRVYIYSFSADLRFVSSTNEWCRTGVSPVKDDHQALPLDGFPWAQKKLMALAREQEVLFVEDVQQMPEEAATEKALLEAEGVHSLFWVPLHAGGQITGFLGMDALRDNQWRADQADLLIVVGNLLSEAMEKHRLSGDLVRLSLTDPLTGLYNRRHLLERMTAMYAEYNRSGKLYSIVMLDLDRFKATNDTYGHAAGDYILQRFAGILQKNIRPSDVAARYGGEEFIVLLSDAGKEQAHQLAERLLENTRDVGIEFDGTEHRITTSAGVACVEETQDARNLDLLIQMADHRLYQAKDAGRDRIVA